MRTSCVAFGRRVRFCSNCSKLLQTTPNYSRLTQTAPPLIAACIQRSLLRLNYIIQIAPDCSELLQPAPDSPDFLRLP